MKFFKALLVFHTACIFFFFYATTASSEISSNGLTTRLIHTQSVLSPTFDPNTDPYTRFQQMLQNDKSRLNYLKSRESQQPSLTNTVSTALLPTWSAYLVVLGIGSPVEYVKVAMDTASELLWVKETNCLRCSIRGRPSYSHDLSSTFKPLPCSSPHCRIQRTSGKYSCNSTNNQCLYYVRYGSLPDEKGFLGTESFTWLPPNNGLVKTVSDIVFGVATHSTLQGHGIMGLNQFPNSIVKQLQAKKFSYCLGNMSDLSNSFNQLSIGDEAKLYGNSTPLMPPLNPKINAGHYYVRLSNIILGKNNLFTTPFRVLIDSGSTLTYFEPDKYAAIEREVRPLMQRFEEADSFKGMLCYIVPDILDVPDSLTLTFVFEGGAEFYMDVHSLWKRVNYPSDYKLCLAIKANDDYNLPNIIGVTAQQYHNVGFDLEDMLMFIEFTECEGL